MKLLFDQNLSHQLVRVLAAEYPGSAHVRDFALEAAPDPVVWSHVAAHAFILVSKDTDFQQRALLFGHPPKVVWIRIGNCTTTAVATLLRTRTADVQAFVADLSASFLVLK
jgi:predicted nuclease of predicted toxin-antitoxin system